MSRSAASVSSRPTAVVDKEMDRYEKNQDIYTMLIFEKNIKLT